MALPFELQDDERLLQQYRRHWVFLLTKLLWQAAAGAVPIAVLVAIAIAADASGIALVVMLVAAGAWAVFWLVRIYFTWYRYQNDVWVITDQRIVDSLKRHWFHHEMSSADLVDVEDMSIRKHGVLATIFNFGDLQCQTAGAQARFVLSAIPDPAEVLGVVDASRDAARRELRA